MPGAASRDIEKADFFISRAGADADFAAVIGSILEDAGSRVILQQWDFANTNFMGRMQTALQSGARVIALVSPAYFKSDHCMAEALNTIGHDPLNKNGRLIVMRTAECAPSGLFTALAYWDLVPLRDHASRLREIVLEAVDRATPRTAPSSFFITPKTVLHDRIREIPNFTGRRKDIRRVRRALRKGKPAALHGGGGVGKSTLAIQYGWENRARYAGVWWLGADTQASIVDGLVALGAIFIPGLAEVKDRPEAASAVLKFIADGGFEKPWLLLYDNVEQPKALDGLLPRGGAQVLITTRWPDFKGRAAAVPLGVFAPDEAVQFLLKRTDRTDTEGAGRLAHDLGNLPLALDHAAAYCKRTGTSFDTYRAYLPDLIKRAPKGADYPRSVYATFSLAIEQAAADCAEAEKFMGILAYFAPDDIPLSLISADVMSEVARGEAIAALYEVSLLEVENEADQATVSVHRLVQMVMRDRLEDAEELDKAAAFATACTVLVVQAFPQTGDETMRSWAIKDRLLPHALTVLGHAPVEGSGAAWTGYLSSETGYWQLVRGDAKGALANYQKSLAIFEKLAAADPERPDWQRGVSVSLERIADVLQDAGDAKGALANYQKSLAIFEKLAAADPERPDWQHDVALSHGRVAMVLASQGSVSEAAAGFQMGRDIIAGLRQQSPDNATLPKNLAWFDAQLTALKE